MPNGSNTSLYIVYKLLRFLCKYTTYYLNLKTIVTGDSKKEILNKIFKEEIKKTFRLNDNATDEEMQKAIDKKMKQIEGMKNLFK